MATALQLQRSGVDFMIFEKNQAGGLLWNAQLIENYPGFPRGISGPALAEIFREQLEQWKIPISAARVKNLDYRNDALFITTEHSRIKSEVVVIASGTNADVLPAPSIPHEVLDRVFTEAFPLREQSGKHIAIVGAGDAAFDYGLNLACKNRVTILCRGNKPNCLPLLERRVKNSSRITLRRKARLAAIEKNKKGLALSLKEERWSQAQTITADILLVAIGRSPSLDFMGPTVIKRQQKLGQEGRLYFVGDVSNRHYRQAGICVGDGIKAAMRIYESRRAIQT
jgi:thioredoxin reductase (NADPH)